MLWRPPRRSAPTHGPSAQPPVLQNLRSPSDRRMGIQIDASLPCCAPAQSAAPASTAGRTSGTALPAEVLSPASRQTAATGQDDRAYPTPSRPTPLTAAGDRPASAVLAYAGLWMFVRKRSCPLPGRGAGRGRQILSRLLV